MKQKITINAPAILSFVGISLLVYYLAQYTGGMINDQLFSVYRTNDMYNPYTLLRFVTHVFGYATRNEFTEAMLLILILGPMVEEKYGSGKIFAVIFTVALVTGVVHFLVFPGITLMGANGIIYALIIMGSFTGKKDGSIPITFIIVAVVYLGIQFQKGYLSQNDTATIAYVAESVIGGILGGIFTLGGKKSS